MLPLPVLVVLQAHHFIQIAVLFCALLQGAALVVAVLHFRKLRRLRLATATATATL